jgi:hypothetical protein
MTEQRDSTCDEIDEALHELLGFDLVRRGVVDEVEKDSEMSEPDGPAERRAQLLGDARLVEDRDELSNASFSNFRRLLAENRERMSRISKVSEQRREQLAIAA